MMIENWTLRKNPARLERRIDFDNFELLRGFLDLAAEQSKRLTYYPDTNFSRTHVSMTIHFEDGEAPSGVQLEFAQATNVFAPSNRISELVNVEFSRS